ncbi:p-loop containing nucleoside triphosphate hydrolase [Venustampulla echinocandica]|uniref:p-loop containing nucleoside triphosphate hydrolase n=1 Tax=Venustampulla echinocandica TaxID=2656787 RepID=A0A370TQ47_9HELO|nr:p-loop containing nucleoside triphosphate hydrolase [Venustampulla echinocandica]RDL37655.1 p-loop containing nucleoside triphosphate hydrolase [Venustampulla echinocandica]
MSEPESPESFTPVDHSPTPTPMPATAASSLEELQTEEQRLVLDTVARVRKCGLEGTVSLPQIVVCGDQSAGKSSVLEALTEIPFPRNDNLCTRYATEISLRVATSDSITIRVIPDSSRPSNEQASIKTFERTISDFGDLPGIMNEAMTVMGIGVTDESNTDAKPRAFSRDVLSIEFAGPARPQLTLVDIPGLIGTETKVTTKQDIALVAEITQHYIEQPRTICLAVVSAATDYANQTILEKVREVDPEGDRTLGVITKPDMPPAGSGSQNSYIELAQNEDIFFKLGWHVVKNRRFDERHATLTERNILEESFFRTTEWKRLPKESVGVDALRRRLSLLLFEHVKKELPNLREELESALSTTREDLEQLGCARSSGADCKSYLAQLSLDFYETCKAAVDGHYEGSYFHKDLDSEFDISSPSTLCRTRAVVQSLNSKFAEDMRVRGHKYQIDRVDNDDDDGEADGQVTNKGKKSTKMASNVRRTVRHSNSPKQLNSDEALDWVGKALTRNRGKELIGNFNPLLIGELFWEQSERWNQLAIEHLEAVSAVCTKFLKTLLQDKCPEDVKRRIWGAKIQDALKTRHQAAMRELSLLMKDHQNYPINYNHYYTDTITKRRQARQKAALSKLIKGATSSRTSSPYDDDDDDDDEGRTIVNVDVEKVLSSYAQTIDPDMDNYSSEEVLDCLFAIYKVSQKTFVANVTMQVVERHIVRGLEKIFSPVLVSNLDPKEAEDLASEPASARRKREYLEDQIKKLEEGREIFKHVI